MKNMTKKEIRELRKKVVEYKDWLVRSGQTEDPFYKEHAYWAAGLAYFLTWLEHEETS